MATTITVMHDTQTHAVVMVNADGAGLQPGPIVLTNLVGAQLNAFGGSSAVPPRVAITRIQSSCSPSAVPAPGTGLDITVPGLAAPITLNEGVMDFDGLNIIQSLAGDIILAPRDASVAFTVILTLKKIKGFAGSAQIAKIG